MIPHRYLRPHAILHSQKMKAENQVLKTLGQNNFRLQITILAKIGEKRNVNGLEKFSQLNYPKRRERKKKRTSMIYLLSLFLIRKPPRKRRKWSYVDLIFFCRYNANQAIISPFFRLETERACPHHNCHSRYCGRSRRILQCYSR